MKCNRNTLTIWDVGTKINCKYNFVVFWQSYNMEDNKSVSIPQLVENNAEQLKLQYLTMVYELGEFEVSGERIIDYLSINQYISYWWMTLITEKCNYSKSPQIDNIIKLMAFKSWLEIQDFSEIQLFSANIELANAISLLAKEKHIDFKMNHVSQQVKSRSVIKKLYDILPDIMQSAIYLLRYTMSRWKFKGLGIDNWAKTSSTTMFISYLFNLDSDSKTSGVYKSKYWSDLPDLLYDQNIESNWLHIYVPSELLPTTKDAKRVIEKFNNSAYGRQSHVLLDSFLNINVILATLEYCFRITSLKKTLFKEAEKKCSYIWPLLEKDFRSSFSGMTVASNFLSYFLFRRATSIIPKQDKGFYLMENQGWEFGFLNAWFSSGHGNCIVGVPHSTVRYWDLRYFHDKRMYNLEGYPQPSFIAVNGRVAKNMYLNSGCPNSKLVDAEALRYLDLNSLSGCLLDISKSNNCILILGDYLQENVRQQLDILVDAIKYLKGEIKYFIKPHPMCPIFPKNYPTLNLTVIDKPIAKIINHCAAVYTSNITSAAVDAYCAGKIVISVLDPKKLNMSPLRNIEGVQFISSSIELARSLNDIDKAEGNVEMRKGYFFLDRGLPRWKKLLTEGVE